MLVFQTNPLGVKRFLLFQQLCIDAVHLSENALDRDEEERPSDLDLSIAQKPK